MAIQQEMAKGYELAAIYVQGKILAALVVFIIGRWVFKYLGYLIRRTMAIRHVDPLLT